MSKLVINMDGKHWEIDLRGKTNIGRSKDNHVYLRNHRVSKHHAMIVRTDQGFLFTDQGSKNGSFLSQKAIEARILRNGDAIKIGSAYLTFIEEMTASPTKSEHKMSDASSSKKEESTHVHTDTMSGTSPQIESCIPYEIQQGIKAKKTMILHNKEQFVFDFVFSSKPAKILNARVFATPQHAQKIYLALREHLNMYQEKFGQLH